MSSEMRELIAKWRSEVDGGPDRELKEIGYDACLLDCADELEALLARTEAGAVCDHAWQPDSDVMNARYCPKCDVTQTIPKKLTHPQDASGDAELSELRRVLHKLADYWIAVTRDKDVAHRDRAIIDAYDKGLTKCATELRAAMQAKEAK